MELTARKKQILKVVTERYIDAAEPVGSKFIAQAMGGNLSSATIRNELADLTEKGYLEQPHTSAGRIPSPKGYRLYVNELMERRAVSDQEAAAINQALGGRMRELDSVIAQAGQMVSSIVSYPAYAAAVGKGGVTVRRFDLLPVDGGSFIAVVMTGDSRVKSRLLHTDLPVEGEQLSALANLLNTHFTEASPEAMGEKLMALTGQLPPELFMPLSLAVEYAGEVVDQSARNQVFTTGQTQLLLQPEFQDPGRANELMRLLTDQKAELPVLDENTPMQILIGPENVNEALKDASVVVASYDIGDNMRGLIGVVGPTRMDYAAVAARLSYFAESLTKMFGKNHHLPPKEERSGGRKKKTPPWRRRRLLRPRLRRRPLPRPLPARKRPSPSPESRWRRWRGWRDSWPPRTTSISAWRRSTTTTASAPPRRRSPSTRTPGWTPSRGSWRSTTIWSGR